MDKKQLEDMIEPSIMQKFNEINEIHKQMDLLYQIRNSSKISEMMEQNARISSASNIGEIARKAFQQSGLDSTSFENQSAIARFAQSRSKGAVAFQDTLLEARKGLSTYNNILPVRERIVQSMGGASVYEDMMMSVNLFRKSLEPLRSSFNTAHSIFETSEISRLVRDIQSQKAITNSFLSDYAGIFKQVELLRNLESFKAISRLKNFPKDSVWQQDYSELPEITESSIVEAKKIDAEISDEILSVDDFNDLSEETQNSLKQVFSEYYEYFIIKTIVSLCLLQENLNKDLDLSNKSFIFVNNLEGSIFFIGNYWNQNKAAIINGLITTAIYNALIWLFFIK